MRFETKAIHAGEEPNLGPGSTGDVVVPLHLASTFARRKVADPPGGYEYSRTGNPTRHALEVRLAALEGARYGLAYASGMAAETTVGLTLLRAGDHLVACDDLYGGTRRLFDTLFAAHFNIAVDYVDARDPERVRRALRPETRLLWLETPTNPLLKLCDIAALSELAHAQEALVAVDNTFMSPYLQRPLELGADLVVHSTTKYLNGHSDSVGGAVVTSDTELYDKLQFNQNAAGAVLSPFDSFLTLRGTKTLPLRMERHEANARQIAAYLESHPKVVKVNYPGLASHPQHELACRQATGFGGMISFEIEGGLAEADRFLQQVELFALAESLGGVESLIEHPAAMTHASIPSTEREHIGITDSLLRLSVGIEHVEDLIGDLDRAFSAL